MSKDIVDQVYIVSKKWYETGGVIGVFKTKEGAVNCIAEILENTEYFFDETDEGELIYIYKGEDVIYTKENFRGMIFEEDGHTGGDTIYRIKKYIVG